jgi:hypothetical protein
MKLVLREKGCTEEGAGEPEKALGDNFGYPVTQPRTMEANLQDAGSAKKGPHIAMLDECGCGCDSCMGGEHHEEDEVDDSEELTQRVIAGLYDDPEAIYIVIGEEDLTEEKKKGDRCVRIAKRKYHKWPSAYASGAVVKCRQGKIWKGLKESANIVEYEVLSLTLEEAVSLLEKYKPNFSLEKSQGLHGWFKRNKGKGWIDCKTGKPCGREKAGRGAKRKYPACRPTKAQCNKSGTRRKRTGASVSWKPKKDK